MTFALIIDNTIRSVGSLPGSARRLDTGEWVMGLSSASTDLQEACGYFAVTAVERPADTATTTFDLTVELIAGVPTEVWTERAKTQEELDAEAAADRQATRVMDLTSSVATLRTWADDAAATTVTSGNAVATLQVVVNRLGVFFDRFADLLENQYGEQP